MIIKFEVFEHIYFCLKKNRFYFDFLYSLQYNISILLLPVMIAMRSCSRKSFLVLKLLLGSFFVIFSLIPISLADPTP